MFHSRITLGYVPTRRNNFSVEEALKYKRLIRIQLDKADIQVVDLEDINDEGLLLEQQDILHVIKKMKDNEVDALFFPHCNFGCEGAIGQVAAALDVPVLLYGPRDDAPDESGSRTRDSQCGLFASGKVMCRHNIPFSYIPNVSPDDACFKNGFERFIRVAAVVKAMKNIRILQIGPRPNDFLSVMTNEGELLEKFGVQVFPISLLELQNEMGRISTEERDKVDELSRFIQNHYTGPGAQWQKPRETLAAMKLAIRKFAEDYRCGCACIQCWSAMQNSLDVFPCAVNSMLADEGFPVACETDINGAISAILIQSATGNSRPHFLADLTVRHPEKDNVELLWHCGAFPSAFAKNKEDCKITQGWDGKPQCGNCAWELQNGDITICRFDGDHGEYSLFLGEGLGVDGPHCKGTYTWFEVDDWVKWEYKLVQGPYIHHVAGTYGHVADVLYEACRYIPHLSPDPVTPTAEQLQRRYLD